MSGDLPAGFSYTTSTSGSQTDAGTSENPISYQIYDADGTNVTSCFPNASVENGFLTVYPATLTIETGSATKIRDWEALTCPDYTVTGLKNGETITVTVTGSQTDIGSSDNTYTMEWGTAKEGNYTVMSTLGTLTVSPVN